MTLVQQVLLDPECQYLYALLLISFPLEWNIIDKIRIALRCKKVMLWCLCRHRDMNWIWPHAPSRCPGPNAQHCTASAVRRRCPLSDQHRRSSRQHPPISSTACTGGRVYTLLWLDRVYTLQRSVWAWPSSLGTISSRFICVITHDWTAFFEKFLRENKCSYENRSHPLTDVSLMWMILQGTWGCRRPFSSFIEEPPGNLHQQGAGFTVSFGALPIFQLG